MEEVKAKVVNAERKETIRKFLTQNKLQQLSFYVYQFSTFSNIVLYAVALLLTVVNVWFVCATDLHVLTYLSFGALELFVLRLVLPLLGIKAVEQEKADKAVEDIAEYLASCQTKEIPAEHKEKVEAMQKNELYKPLLTTIVLVLIAIVTSLFSNKSAAILTILFVFGAPVAVKFGLVARVQKLYTETLKPKATKLYEEKVKPMIEEAKNKRAGGGEAPAAAPSTDSPTE
ncbi:hypothetical protein BLNAU_5701 [Blattamonas nauphoetae]|uniref:Reticulon-like protein n=1 Tax=Blattamonas nauphoetae TaxID=2049346 RepID=A0ABQ9Y6M6_9EUKA|nr:hypothetical protein BLNAU_5701 [Blattamonas nauphoetae]